MPRPKPPLRTVDHFLVTLVLAVILPVALFGGVASWWIAADIRRHADARSERLAAGIAQDVAAHVSLLTAAMKVLARSPAIASGNFAMAYRHAQGLSADLGQHIGLATPDGRQIFNTRRPFGTELPPRADARSYSRALRTGQPSVSDVIIGAIARAPLVTVDVPTAGPAGPLVLGTSTDTDHIATILARTQLDEGLRAAVVDSEGRYIAHGLGPETPTGVPAPREFADLARSAPPSGKSSLTSDDGARLVAYFHKVPGTGWTAVVSRPAEIFGPYGPRYGLLVGGGVAALCLTGLIGLRLSRCLRGEAVALTDAAQALGSRRPVRVEALRLREFAEVGDALRQAAARLLAREEALRTSEARYRGLVESQSDLILRFGPDGGLTFVNETACRALGRGRAGLIGQPWSIFVHPDEVAAAAAMVAEAMSAPDRRARVTCRLPTADGPRWFAWEGVTLVGDPGAPRELQAVGRDVTEQIGAQRALQTAKAEAEAATMAKSRFLAAASHDLRQPFQAMRLFYEVLHPQLQPAQQSVAARLDEAMAAGEQLLGALLDVSTLDAGTVRVNVETFPVGDVLRQVAAECEPQARAAGLRLRHVAPDTLVCSDKVLLTRMVRNLALNAIRYTREGAVLLGCRSAGPDLRIEVRDTGIGIAEDQLALIFGDFYQVGGGGHDRTKGLGLGLSVVARMGRLLGHPVTVSSRPGRGSCFAITLPRAAVAAPARERVTAE